MYKDLMREVCAELSQLPVEERIDALNECRTMLHEVSPLKSQPVDCVLWVPAEEVEANEYNPNKVAPPEMRLLYDSIRQDGYTMPDVTYLDNETGKRDIVDGFHRRQIQLDHPDISALVYGRLPVTTIHKPLAERMASTIRHNRARGAHDVDLMSNIVRELHDLGRSDAWIAKHLGMDADEILRLKQITGLAALFTDGTFSRAWVPGGVTNGEK